MEWNEMKKIRKKNKKDYIIYLQRQIHGWMDGWM